MSAKDVVIVIDDQVFRVPRRVMDLYISCAGQMIQDGAHRDYYKGMEKKAVLDAVSDLHFKLLRTL